MTTDVGRLDVSHEEIEIAQLIAMKSQALAIINGDDLRSVLKLKSRAEAAVVYAKSERSYREAGVHLSELAARAARRAGELLAEMPKAQGKRTDLVTASHEVKTLEELGVSRKQSSRWQTLAAIPDDEFEQQVKAATEAGEYCSITNLESIGRAHKSGKPLAVAANTGEIEWYTPAEYIELAREVMGSIDLDPATSKKANETVRASQYFDAKMDGLRAARWSGNVWLNPPYSVGLLPKFVAKFVHHWERAEISQALVLVNNATDTGWFQDLAARSSGVCFKAGRIAFVNAQGESVRGAAQGQAFLYFGTRFDAFASAFRSVGVIVRVVQ